LTDISHKFAEDRKINDFSAIFDQRRICVDVVSNCNSLSEML